jgi:hypothetical protein
MVELIHNTTPERLRQIAEDLRSEGWYTIAGTIAQVADEKEEWQRQAQCTLPPNAQENDLKGRSPERYAS